MDKLIIAECIVYDNYADLDCGIFNTRNICGDSMTTLYDEDGLVIDACYYWSYFEVFGLTETDFDDLESFYNLLRKTPRETILKINSIADDVLRWRDKTVELPCDEDVLKRIVRVAFFLKYLEVKHKN